MGPDEGFDRRSGLLARPDLSLRLNPDLWLRCFFDGRVSGSGRTAGAFWPSGTGCVGFRWTGWGTDDDAKGKKHFSGAGRGWVGGIAGSFPGQAHVLDEAAREAELGVSADDEPRPAVGLFGCSQRRCGPSQGVLGEPVGVFDVETAKVGSPAQVEVGGAWS